MKEYNHMEKIRNTIRRMSLFQKIQVLSAFIPSYSCLLVIVATYIVCWKNKLPFLSCIVCSFIYFALHWLALNYISVPLIKYIICYFISLIGNYSLVCIQMKEK